MTFFLGIPDGSFGNLSVICGSPTTSTVSSTLVPTTTLSSTLLTHASSPITSSVETTSVVNTIENTDVTLSSNTITVSYDSLSMESTTDNQEMLCKYIGGLIQ